MNRLHLRLFWEGSWDISTLRTPENIPRTAGIYMITAMRSQGNPAISEDAEIIYIGESDNLYLALSQCKLWSRWEKFAKGKSLRLNIAKTDHLECRRTIAAVLAFQNKPKANSRFVNISMFRYVHVDLMNYGQCTPLHNMYNERDYPSFSLSAHA
ncbi:MAG: hypothetical protein ACRCYO_09455 [Bacteroidia bacterium]